MDKLFALLAFLASLAGCDGGRDAVVHRIVGNGVDRLLSRATVQDGVLRLDCVRSSSGACHYVVLPHGCARPDACTATARRFAVAAGQARQVAGVHAFRLCVTETSGPAASTCTASDALGD